MDISGIRSGEFQVIALDPGGTTGWAQFRQEVLINPYGQLEWIDSRFPLPAAILLGQIGPEPHYKELYDFLQRSLTHNTRVVCESFQNRGMDKELVACELVGVVKMFEQDVSDTPCFSGRQWVFWETASQVTSKKEGGSFWTDDKLKKLNLYAPDFRHAMDACRHLLQHMTFTMGDRRWLNLLK
jgi:hypothetical protein